MIITRDDASPKKSQTGVKRTHYKRAQVGAGTRTIPRTSKSDEDHIRHHGIEKK